MKAVIFPERLAKLQTADLLANPQANPLPSGGVLRCNVMEAAGWVSGCDEWTTHPPCVSPLIADLMLTWGARLSDDDRQRILKPLIPKVIGTGGGSEADEDERVQRALDWLIGIHTPLWLAAAGLADAARALADHPTAPVLALVARLLSRDRPPPGLQATDPAIGPTAALAVEWTVDAYDKDYWRMTGDAMLITRYACALAAERRADIEQVQREAMNSAATDLMDRLIEVG